MNTPEFDKIAKTTRKARLRLMIGIILCGPALFETFMYINRFNRAVESYNWKPKDMWDRHFEGQLWWPFSVLVLWGIAGIFLGSSSDIRRDSKRNLEVLTKKIIGCNNLDSKYAKAMAEYILQRMSEADKTKIKNAYSATNFNNEKSVNMFVETVNGIVKQTLKAMNPQEQETTKQVLKDIGAGKTYIYDRTWNYGHGGH